MTAGKQERHTLQRGARRVMPGLSRKAWHDPREHPDPIPVVNALYHRSDGTYGWVSDSLLPGYGADYEAYCGF